jgi:transcriptional adapter 3
MEVCLISCSGVGAELTLNATEKRRKIGSSSPESKRDDSDESENEHQPAQAAPFIVREPLGGKYVYEIPTVDDNASYHERAQAFAVASFPTDDLTNLIAGYPPDEDFSKAKPTTQVGITTFNAYIKPYFRPFSEEDLRFLRERGDRLQPSIITKPEKHYSETWVEEDRPGPSFTVPVPVSNSSHKSVNAPRRTSHYLSEEQLYKDEGARGPNLTPPLSLRMNEDGDDNGDSTLPVNGESPQQAVKSYAASLPGSSGGDWGVLTGQMGNSVLEEGVRREMENVGLPDPGKDLEYDTQPDDEVSRRLQKLQKRLKEKSILNGARKVRIAEKVKEQMAYHEYGTILEDLNKQVLASTIPGTRSRVLTGA